MGGGGGGRARLEGFSLLWLLKIPPARPNREWAARQRTRTCVAIMNIADATAFNSAKLLLAISLGYLRGAFRRHDHTTAEKRRSEKHRKSQTAESARAADRLFILLPALIFRFVSSPVHNRRQTSSAARSATRQLLISCFCAWCHRPHLVAECEKCGILS